MKSRSRRVVMIVATAASLALLSAPNTAQAATTAGGIRVVHTPKILVDDMHLHAGQCHVRVIDAASGEVLPDPSCTPGAIDPAVTQDNIDDTICASGYTTTVRPSATVTGRAKLASLADYGELPKTSIEYDHLIPLELGGATSTSNLWPEPNAARATGVNNPKDRVENDLRRAVCDRQVSLGDAQEAIATDWTTAEADLGLGY